MNWIGLALTVCVGFAFGVLGQLTSGYSKGGWIVFLFVGIIGAFLGVWAGRQFDLAEVYVLKIGSSVEYPIIWAIVGSVFLVAAMGLFVRPRR